MNIIWHEILSSTNDQALKDVKRLDNLSIIATFCQTAGRGQQGNKWSSETSQNLLFSILLKEFACFGFAPLPAGRQFLLSRAAALSVVAFLEKWGLKASIKWPNDIYVGDKKIAGILIENGLQGNTLVRSIIGIGINLGQRDFPPGIPHPTSVSLLTGTNFTRESLQTELARFGTIFEGFLQMDAGRLTASYEKKLYRKGSWYPYRDSRTGERFEACFLGTEDAGRAVLETREGGIRKFAFKELEFLI
ncbi:MAG: biotin--[acetyl-CoA-carboxylase] ligase [Bacteroidales bacterium]|nr:biotin--[acetyl-CoA-carboxylase] ligase [Bacteroidales bacterium]